ncbi:molybdate ABC transporter permease subunit [Ramlibacter sp. AN1015]|uniref:molybdate ABC transporter permease subunit n=1 Tax=Ramlibacter sp. AN1015 TaxID=3133428 RepID=UPI0030C3D9B6
MDWTALKLSFLLALGTCLTLLPLGILVARPLARSRARHRWLVEAALNLPLVLPPTVLGFYLLVALGAGSPLGAAYEHLVGHPLAFSFEGLLLASVLFNIPFAVVPMLRAFEGVGEEVLQAARSCGMTPWQAFVRVELPLAWPGVVSGLVLTAAHTLGEFGVVLMVGGSIPGETKTIAIAIYDRVQAFDMRSAGTMSAFLLLVSMVALGLAARQGRTARAL